LQLVVRQNNLTLSVDGIPHGSISADNLSGSVWFVNPGVKHYAINNGATSRNHLIISMDSQEFLRDM
jgi:hypothetical protein